MKNYEISDTKKEAEWIEENWSYHWKCSNCGNVIDVTKTYCVEPFCGICGFKMKNPHYIHIEYDYD